MQTRLVLIRHGEVEAAWRRRIYGSQDVPLSELGMRQAKTAAAHLAATHLDVIVSSNLARALYGARELGVDRKIDAFADADLREIDRGRWVGKTIEQLNLGAYPSHANWSSNPSEVRPPGGENLEDLARRVYSRLDHWASKYAGKTIGIVAHSWVIRVALCEAMGLHLNRATNLQLGTGAIGVVDWSAGKREGCASEARVACLVGLGIRSMPPRTQWFVRPR